LAAAEIGLILRAAKGLSAACAGAGTGTVPFGSLLDRAVTRLVSGPKDAFDFVGFKTHHTFN